MPRDRFGPEVKSPLKQFCRAVPFWVAGLALIAGVESSRAATFENLYTVSVAPDAEAGNDRRAAARRGMSVLLTRVTGRQQAAAYPELGELVANAERYMTSYGFSADEIRVGFNQALIEQALTRLNMPIWGDERPATLLFVAADFGNGERAELRAADASEAAAGGAGWAASNPLSPASAAAFEGVVEQVIDAAAERGLPLVLPLLDAVDRETVRFADVWGGFDPIVARAAERYDVDAIVVARVAVTEAETRVRWTVIRGARTVMLTPPRPRDAVDWLADEFASEFTTTGDARLAWLTVSGIEQVRDYARVIDYLNSVSIIEYADVESMAGNELLLRVAARGDDERLRAYLALDGQLVPQPDGEGLVFVPAWRIDPEEAAEP